MTRIGILSRPLHGQPGVLPAYLDAITQAKGTPMVITPHDDLEAVWPALDGILIPGGGDVDPARYGQANTASVGIDGPTDELDLTVIHRALADQIPILGICRGLQVINVALGGSLIQDIPTQRESTIDHNLKLPVVGHWVSIEPTTHLASLLGPRPMVNTYHHQGIDRLADGLKAIAWSDDGLIEAVEAKGLLAVQWHPERMRALVEVQALFADFIARCSAQ